MALQLEGRWLWDFWLARDDGRWHLFFLHAPRTPSEPEARHTAAVIGHAVSTDLASWDVQPDVIVRGAPGEWDDASTWTGSVIRDPAGGWAMLYTGTRGRERALVQRIGLARFADLSTWTKHDGNPVLEADPRWYELLDLDAWFDQAWRDPHVIQDPDTGDFHVFVTARAATGAPAGRGVIGHAVSQDLVDWSVTAPIDVPRGFGYMEIPQVFRLAERWHLLYSAPAWVQQMRPGPHCTGTFHAVADAPTGPFRERAPLFCFADERLYGGKLVRDGDDLWCLAFRNRGEDSSFVGELTDPMSVGLGADGELVLM